MLTRSLGAALICAASCAPWAVQAAWTGTPTPLESDTNNTASPPVITTSDAGVRTAAWAQFADLRVQVWNGSAWSGPVNLTGLPGTQPENVGIASTGATLAVPVLIWRQQVGGVFQVFVSRNVGGTWSAPTRLDTINANAYHPVIAGSRDGSAWAVWRQTNGAEVDVFAAHMVPSGTWGLPIKLDTLTGATNVPQVAMDDSGRALVVWEQDDGSADSVFATYWNGTAWTAPQQIDGISGYIDTPHVAMNAAGDGVATWVGVSGKRNTYASRWDVASGVWSVPIQLDIAAGDTDLPRAAINAAGARVVVWQQADTGNTTMQAVLGSGSGWTAPVQLGTSATGTAITPRVALNAAGNAIAVWGASDIYASVLEGGSWGAAQALESASGVARYPEVALNDAGDGTVVWQQDVAGVADPYAVFLGPDVTYTIAVSVTPVGGGTASCTPNPVPASGDATCTASPAAGYQFTGWSGDCTGATCTMTNVQGNRSVVAQFAAVSSYTISVTVLPAGTGTASCTPNPAPAGATVTCTAVAAPGYHFFNWSGDCTGATCTMTNVQGNRSVVANMTATSTFPITVNVLPAGSGTASCTPNPVAEGGTTTCTVVPAGPWGVLSWAGTGTGGCAGTACTFVNVTEARTLSVTLDVPIAAEPEAQPVPALGARALLVLTWLVAGLGVALRRRQSSQ